MQGNALGSVGGHSRNKHRSAWLGSTSGRHFFQEPRNQSFCLLRNSNSTGFPVKDRFSKFFFLNLKIKPPPPPPAPQSLARIRCCRHIRNNLRKYILGDPGGGGTEVVIAGGRSQNLPNPATSVTLTAVSSYRIGKACGFGVRNQHLFCRLGTQNRHSS